MLLINNLNVNIENKKILNNLNLTIKSGEVHAIMGPNGSGKSTLSATLAGKEQCQVTSGNITFKGKDVLSMTPEDRAGEGIFIAFQYPIEIPGVSNFSFLHTALNAVRKYRKKSILDQANFTNLIKKKINLLKIPMDFLYRSVNVGFSGGEKKRNDILQMIILEPELSVLDETDSGLDIDALKIITNNINILRNKHRSFIIITHYKRIMDYIKPDYVHIINQGKIIKSGDFLIVKQLEEQGYGWLKKANV